MILSSKDFIVFQVFPLRPLGKLSYKIIDSKVQQLLDIVLVNFTVLPFLEQLQLGDIQKSVGYGVCYPMTWYLHNYSLWCVTEQQVGCISQSHAISNLMQKINVYLMRFLFQIISFLKNTKQSKIGRSEIIFFSQNNKGIVKWLLKIFWYPQKPKF